MAKLFNRAKMTTATTGSGTVTLGSASSGFQTFAAAGASNGDVVQYVIEEGANFEIGTGTFSSSGNSLTRSPTESSNSNNAITLAGQATVSITAVADDLNRLQHGGSDKVTASSTGASVTGNLAVSGTVDGRDVASDGSKLDGIESGATADQTASEIRALVESASDSNVFTDADHSKLNGIEAGATGDQTNAEIRAAVEAATDSNVFTDADHTKLNGIEANAKNDQTITAGGGLTGGGTGDVTLSHSDTSSVVSTDNSGNTFVQDLTFDTYGHVTAVGTGSVSVGDGTLTEQGTGALGGSGTFTANQSGNTTISISHDDTSSQASVNGSGRTYIQDVTLDAYGHVTGLATATETVVNTDTNTTDWRVQNSGGTQQFAVSAAEGVRFAGSGATSVSFDASTQKITISSTDTNTDTNTTYSAGSGLSLSGTTFSHSDTSSQASVNGSGRTYIQDITLDTYGHVTGLATATETVVNTDTNTNQLTTFQVEDGDGTEVTISHGKEWKFVEAGGININWSDTSTGSDGDPFDLSFNISTSISAGGGLTGGGQLNATRIISHADTSSQGSVNYSGATVIQDVTLDTYGHVTGLGAHSLSLLDLGYTGATDANNYSFPYTVSASASNSTVVQRHSSGYIYANYFNTTPNDISVGSITKICAESGDDGYIRHASAAAVRNFLNVANGATANQGDITNVSAGGGLTGGGSSGGVTLSHSDTSSQASVNNSGRTYIQDITLDTYGHITGITSATETVVNTDTNTTYSAGTNLSLSGTTFNVSANPSFTDVYVADQIIHTGDTDTYMQFHAANQWRVVAGGTERLEVNGGTITANGTFNNTSDERLKENVKPIQNALADICQLEGVTFDWKDTGANGQGFIAQQVEPIISEIVKTDEDTGMKSINYVGLIGHLVEAIKEQQTQIDDLKAEIKNIKS